MRPMAPTSRALPAASSMISHALLLFAEASGPLGRAGPEVMLRVGDTCAMRRCGAARPLRSSSPGRETRSGMGCCSQRPSRGRPRRHRQPFRCDKGAGRTARSVFKSNGRMNNASFVAGLADTQCVAAARGEPRRRGQGARRRLRRGSRALGGLAAGLAGFGSGREGTLATTHGDARLADPRTSLHTFARC